MPARAACALRAGAESQSESQARDVDPPQLPPSSEERSGPHAQSSVPKLELDVREGAQMHPARQRTCQARLNGVRDRTSPVKRLDCTRREGAKGAHEASTTRGEHRTATERGHLDAP